MEVGSWERSLDLGGLTALLARLDTGDPRPGLAGVPAKAAAPEAAMVP